MNDEIEVPADRDDPEYVDPDQPGKNPEDQPKAPNDWPKVTPDRKPAEPTEEGNP